jgi:hypothetical protein
VNYNYAAKMHRDAGNVGPSIAISLGKFVGDCGIAGEFLP